MKDRAKLVRLLASWHVIAGAPVDIPAIEKYVDGIVAWDLSRHIRNVSLAIKANQGAAS